MSKVLKIAAVIVLLPLIIGVIGWLIGAVVKTVLFLALAAGVVYLFAAATGRTRLAGAPRPRSVGTYR